MIRSQNGNPIYWEQGEYPDWSRVSGYRHFPNGLPGTGVEPHYHDNDEMWLFTAGHGEVWLDDVQYAITPGTMVYTPMGCLHRFQMFTSYENNAIVTPLERKQRPIHITVEDYGPPTPTVPGFVVPGDRNTGPMATPGQRCPLSEWRKITLTVGEIIDEATLAANEHWLVMKGKILLGVDNLEIELSTQSVRLYTRLRANSTPARFGVSSTTCPSAPSTHTLRGPQVIVPFSHTISNPELSPSSAHQLPSICSDSPPSKRT